MEIKNDVAAFSLVLQKAISHIALMDVFKKDYKL